MKLRAVKVNPKTIYQIETYMFSKGLVKIAPTVQRIVKTNASANKKHAIGWCCVLKK
jgi:hypothetical protein